MNDMSRTIRPQFEQARLNEALFRAARAGETARVREALEAGADSGAHEMHGMTPLLAAVQHRRLDVIRLLVEAGADPDGERQGMDGFTPLHMAAQRDNLDAVSLLLELGADAAKRTWLTPIDWAVSRPVVEALVNAGADPGSRCPETGQTPLHRRACTSMFGPMAALLDAGADHSTRDLLGRTPLHHVTLGHRRGNVAMAVALLLGAGADAQARDFAGETVLQLARRRRDGIALAALGKAGVRGAPAAVERKAA
ncbi:MAG: ankyrin repeat domain-containing protein [Boseongicola sp.]|nr:ankyrin repeat domain-containing protein [Boseongicola sp.]